MTQPVKNPTQRQVFDTVKAHLLKQGKKSQVEDKDDGAMMCAYRGECGTSCAVGCLIPNDIYHFSMEGKLVFSLYRTFPVLESYGISKENLDLLARLQQIHDMESLERWPVLLDELEASFAFDKTRSTL